MKYIKLILPLIVIFIFSGCGGQTIMVPPGGYFVKYQVTGDVPEISVSFSNEDREIIKAEAQPLPWEYVMRLSDEDLQIVYLSAEVGEDSVFVPAVSGSATGTTALHLVDSSASFTDTVEIDDIVYEDPAVSEFAVVREVISDTELLVSKDYFTAGDNYFIYKQKNLSISVSIDDEVFKTDSSTSFYHLGLFVQDIIRTTE